MNAVATTETTQCLTFKLQSEVFALDIATVREVLDFTSITRVPNTPIFMRGVINLRGGVVPVIDLRVKFGMSATERTVHTCIIIVEVVLHDERTILGVMADSVQEVINLSQPDIEPAPRIGTHLKTDFLKGMGRYKDRFLMLLDIDKVFSISELTDMQGGGAIDRSATA